MGKEGRKERERERESYQSPRSHEGKAEFGSGNEGRDKVKVRERK